jgi:hypothetical protein
MSNLSTCSTNDSERSFRGPVSFPKSKRFTDQNNSFLSTTAMDINPKYDLIKKSTPSITIKKPYNTKSKKSEEVEKKNKADPIMIYEVKYDFVEKNKKKGAVFPKSTRFNPPKAEELQDINPKTTLIK